MTVDLHFQDWARRGRVSHSSVGDHPLTAEATNLPDQSEWRQNSQTADHVVLNNGAEEPEHLPRTMITKWRKPRSGVGGFCGEPRNRKLTTK